ncbi:MAG: hypothetical protein R3B13_38785 [Polyangiaceae bacterium]
MKEDAFSSRIKEMFNDMLLTDRYLGFSSYAVACSTTRSTPSLATSGSTASTALPRHRINEAVAREPQS